MLIKRLYLRNFRVYEDELDLEVPPGLVGVYGPNGAGKSTLLEAILFTLWGKARTTKDQIRSAGVGGDCITEVEFEHEGHLYLVRRTLKGINSNVSVEAHCDGALMSTGTRDAERYVESVLGMDDGAFRASVFTEQKQLAAFSNQSPAERRRLVLQLLGITPLDTARDSARREAREMAADHERLRGMLADLVQLETEAADTSAGADASEVVAAEEAGAAEAARVASEAAAAAFAAEDRKRQEHDALVLEGRAARQEMDTAEQSMARFRSELTQLDDLAVRLTALQGESSGLQQDEVRLEATVGAAAAAAIAAAVEVPPRPAPVDEEALQRVELSASSLREEAAAAVALLRAAEAEVTRAGQALERSVSLSGEGECPTCGQSLGDAFETVQEHRRSDLRQAEAHRAELQARARDLQQAADSARDLASETSQRVAEQRSRIATWEQADRRRFEALEEARRAWQRVLYIGARLWLVPGYVAGDDGPDGECPPAPVLHQAVATGRAEVERKRSAANEMHMIRGRLEARRGLEQAMAEALQQSESAKGRVETLRDKVRTLGFRKEDLDRAAGQRDAASAAAQRSAAAAQRAAITAAQERERARGAALRLAEGRAQHAKLADLESESRHRSRAADLLSEFRNTVVASVGPRLALQAADLFGELTDHEYENIEVDPDTYQLQISDGGRLYGLDRFSGSEIDLANLALRVAISEHIHFQSGGSVGLLVLDEVFSPLDEDRKARMLLALERLKGRFRQVLVVTHDNEIKEQMPAAIEVVKLAGRRATARVVGD